MDKVVILARVSTQAQDYQRQVTELQEYCDRAGWEVTRVFANKVSGAKAVTERTEIVEMVEYIKTNDISRVVCLEISRLGRNTLEALKVINYLSSHGVSLYVKNYNLETLIDGKVNPVASLICTILLEIASMERLTIKERMTSGRNQYIAKCREQGIPYCQHVLRLTRALLLKVVVVAVDTLLWLGLVTKIVILPSLFATALATEYLFSVFAKF